MGDGGLFLMEEESLQQSGTPSTQAYVALSYRAAED